MAVTENEDVDVDETTDTETENAETEDSTDDSDKSDEITYEQAIQWRAEAAEARAEKERREKAEKKLVDLKKAQKTTHNTQQPTGREDVRKILAEERFYEKNPEAASYRDKIEAYQEKGLSLEEAYVLSSRSDKEVEENRNVYGKSIIRGSQDSTEGIKIVGLDAYDRMTEAEQNKYNDQHKAKYGAVRFKD